MRNPKIGVISCLWSQTAYLQVMSPQLARQVNHHAGAVRLTVHAARTVRHLFQSAQSAPDGAVSGAHLTNQPDQGAAVMLLDCELSHLSASDC